MHNCGSGHLAALFTILIWGTTFIATKILLTALTPVEILFLRFALGLAALWLARPQRLRTQNAGQAADAGGGGNFARALHRNYGGGDGAGYGGLVHIEL